MVVTSPKKKALSIASISFSSQYNITMDLRAQFELRIQGMKLWPSAICNLVIIITIAPLKMTNYCKLPERSNE